MNEKDFSELAMCAVRYALGRTTYVSFSVPQAILGNVKFMTTNSLKVIVRDINEYKRMHDRIGMECDEKNWLDFRDMCEEVIKRREAKK